MASSYGVRLGWDPFVRAQRLVDADRPGPGVRTWTRSRHGLTMVSEYLSYRRPSLMGMKMVEGPRLFRTSPARGSSPTSRAMSGGAR